MYFFEDVVGILKNYKKTLAETEVLVSRIDYLEHILNSETEIYYDTDNKFNRTPLVSRPTETEAIHLDDNKKKSKKGLKVEIERLKSILLGKRHDIDKIKYAIETLNPDEKFITECKYFDRMTYDDIVNNLRIDRRFRNKKIWCRVTVIEYAKASLKKISDIVYPKYFSCDNVKVKL